MKTTLSLLLILAALGVAAAQDSTGSVSTETSPVYAPGRWYVSTGGFGGRNYLRSLVETRRADSWSVNALAGYAWRPRLAVQTGVVYRSQAAMQVRHRAVSVPLLLRWSVLKKPHRRLQPFLTVGTSWLQGQDSRESTAATPPVTVGYRIWTVNYGLGLRVRVVSRWWLNAETLSGFWSGASSGLTGFPMGTFYHSFGVLYDLPK